MDTLDVLVSSITIISCIFFAIQLNTLQKNRKDNSLRYLIYFFLISASYYFVLLLYLRNENEIIKIIFPFVLPVFLAIIPSFYTFILSLTRAKLNKKTLFLHILPALLFLVLLIPYYLLPEVQKTNFLTSNIKHNNSSLVWFIHKIYIFGVIFVINLQAIIYIFFFTKTLKNFNIEIEKRFSYKEKINLKWAIVLALLLIVLIIILNFADILGIKDSIVARMIFNIVSLGIFSFIFVKGKNQKNIFVVQNKENKTDIAVNNQINENSNKYKSSYLKEDDKKRIIYDLEKLIDSSDIFLKQNLTIEYLSKELNTNTTYLSQIINEHYKNNFFNFVNNIRVKKASELLLQDKFEKYTIEAIANLSGFSSRTAFYEAFKKTHKMTPTQYKKNKKQINN